MPHPISIVDAQGRALQPAGAAQSGWVRCATCYDVQAITVPAGPITNRRAESLALRVGYAYDAQDRMVCIACACSRWGTLPAVTPQSYRRDYR